jgi:putative DNA-invertase from lambdoid prophage Rac
MAEFERALIQERVKAVLKNARAKGKRLGRPPKRRESRRISARRAQGLGWKRIAAELGVGVGTVLRAAKLG